MNIENTKNKIIRKICTSLLVILSFVILLCNIVSYNLTTVNAEDTFVSIEADWNTGDINTRVTNACAFIDNAGTPYIIAPVQHGVKCFDTEGNLEWTYTGITDGYDVRDITIGNLNNTGYNDCTVIASGYYTNEDDGKIGIVDKDGNELDEIMGSEFTGSPGACYGVAVDGTDIYVTSTVGLNKFIKSGASWVESWEKTIGTCYQISIADLGNGKRIYVNAQNATIKGLYCYQTDGTLDWSYNTGNQYQVIHSYGNSDSTKTGSEITLPFQSGFAIIDKDGNLSENYTDVGNNVRDASTFYDVDGDGEDEIYFTDMGEDSYCIEHVSTNEYDLKYSVANFMDAGESGITHFDINEDDIDEIFLFTTTGHLYIYDPTLTTLIKDLNIGHGTAGGIYISYQQRGNGIHFPDIDADGHADIVISGSNGYVDVFLTTWEAGGDTYDISNSPSSKDWGIVEPDTIYCAFFNSSTMRVLSGEVISIGSHNVTSWGFYYGETTDYGSTVTNNGDQSSGFSWSNMITGLDSTTLYHYKAWATNLDGTAVGSDQTFTTD